MFAQQRSESEEEPDDFESLPRAHRRHGEQWSAEETRKWVENRKLRFPVPRNAQRVKDDEDYEMGVMEQRLRMKLELLKGCDQNEYTLRKRARYLKDLATVQRLKRNPAHQHRTNTHNNDDGDQKVEEVANPTSDPADMAHTKQRHEVLQPRTRDEIVAHLKHKVEEDGKAIKAFTDSNVAHSSNYRYIQNTLFSNLVLDDVLQEREHIMSMLQYMHANNYLQD